MASGNRITTTGVLYINGQQVENTFTNISKITRKLEQELRKTTIGTQEFIDKAAEVKKAREHFENVKNEINAVRNSMQQSSGVLGFFRNQLLSVGDTFRQVFTADLASRFFDTIRGKASQTVDELLEVADAMTDVQKTSGMTLEQVKDLWDSFDEMDTRTSKLDRLKIAEVGGRLGVPTEEMKSFVQEVDKAYVALGDSFEGGLVGVVDQLGKIKGLFEETKTMTYAESINRVGSALNTLAAQGVASEGNIAQFTMRVGTLPESLRPSIDKVLGLGAAFEESGIDAQIAASGFSNFINIAGKNIDSFAYSMNMSKKEAEDLINTSPEEFFLRFAEGMKGLDATTTSKVLESLKLNTLEVQKAVGAAANKTDDFRTSMKTAGEEMEKMTSLQDEFNQKNNNAPAIIDKIRNAWSDMFTSTNILNNFEWLVQLLGWITGVTKEAGDGMVAFKDRIVFLTKIITVLIASIISYNLALTVLALTTKNAVQQTILYNLIIKAKIALTTTARAVTLLFAAAKLVLTGNINRATVAMRAFSIATKANPIGLLIGVIVAAATAFALYSSKIDEATQKKKIFNNVSKTAQDNVAGEVARVQQLVAIARNENIAREQRIEAIRKLNEISPEMLGNLTLENIKTQEATAAINDYIKALERKAMADAFQEKRTDLLKKKNDTLSKDSSDFADWSVGGKTGQSIGNWINSVFRPEDIKNVDFKEWDKLTEIQQNEKFKLLSPVMQSAINNRTNELKDINSDLKNLNDLQKEFLEANPSAVNDVLGGGSNQIVIPTSNNKVAKEKTAEQLAKEREADLKASKDTYDKAEQAKVEADKRMLDFQRQFEDEKSKILQESRQREIDAAEVDHVRKVEDIKTQNDDIKREILKTESEISDLEKSESEAKSEEAKKQYSQAIAKLQDTNNERRRIIVLNNKIAEQTEQTHQFNLQKIKEKWDAQDFEKFVKNEEIRIAELRRLDEEDILSIQDLNLAKQKLKESEFIKLTDTELRNIKSLEEAKKFLREEADRKMLATQLASLEVQKLMIVSAISELTDGPAKEKLLADLATLEQRVTSLKSAIQTGGDQDNKAVVDDSKDKKSQVDILGFSADDWEETFKNLDSMEGKLAAVGKVFSAMGNLAASFAELQRNLGERELKNFEKIQDKKLKNLKKQLNDGYITQEEYTKEVELMEVQLANKQAEIEYKQAKAEKISKMFSAVGSVAQGIASSLAVGGPAGIALAAIVGALGAVQVGIIASQPLPERQSFAQGGYFEGYTGESSLPEDETGERPIGLVKLHRKEWTAPRWMTEHPRLAGNFEYLENVRKTRTIPRKMATGGYLDDDFDNDSSKSNNSSGANPINRIVSEISHETLEVLKDIRDFLQKLDEEGVQAFIVENAKNGKLIDRMVKEWTSLKNKNRY